MTFPVLQISNYEFDPHILSVLRRKLWPIYRDLAKIQPALPSLYLSDFVSSHQCVGHCRFTVMSLFDRLNSTLSEGAHAGACLDWAIIHSQSASLPLWYIQGLAYGVFRTVAEANMLLAEIQRIS